MSETKQLKVGDKVIRYYGGDPIEMDEVVRTTKTQAELKRGAKLRINYTDNFLTYITSDRWSTVSYRLATDEKIEELRLRQLQVKTENLLFCLSQNARQTTRNLTADECNEAIELLNKLTQILTK